MISGSGSAELKKMIEQVRALGNGAHKAPLTAALKQDLLNLTKKGFDTGTSPDGTRYPPLKLRAGGKPLEDTNRLRNAFQASSSDTAIELVNPTKYAAMQNYGTAGLPGGVLKPKGKKALRFFVRGNKKPFFAKQVTIPARPFLPKEGELPDAWDKQLTSTAEKVLHNHVRHSE
jgi:phage gpG-like protein